MTVSWGIGMKQSSYRKYRFRAIAVYALVAAILLSTVGMMCFGTCFFERSGFLQDAGSTVTLSELMHTGFH